MLFDPITHHDSVWINYDIEELQNKGVSSEEWRYSFV